MRFCRFSLAGLFAVLLISPSPAAAALTFDASLKEVYEDNINPLLSGAGIGGVLADPSGNIPVGLRLNEGGLKQATVSGTRTSDFYTVLSASGGAQAEIGVETEMSVRAEITRYQFSKFSDLNATTAAASTALFKQLSDMNSARISITAKLTGYETEALDSSSVAAAFDIRQQVSARFWLQEGLAWENNSTDDNAFTYTARTASLRSGYCLPDNRTVSISYAFHERKFMDGAKTALHSIALSETRVIINHLRVVGTFEHQRYDSVPDHVRAGDNITSVAIVYSY